MIYVIGLVVVAVIAFLVWKNQTNSICKCDKCTDENCKCDENKCDDKCKCHDVAEEAPAPYLNGHSKKITADPTDEPTDSCNTSGHEPCDSCTEEPKAEEPASAKEEPKKEEPKETKKENKKKPAQKKPDPKKKGKGKK